MPVPGWRARERTLDRQSSGGVGSQWSAVIRSFQGVADSRLRSVLHPMVMLMLVNWHGAASCGSDILSAGSIRLGEEFG